MPHSPKNLYILRLNNSTALVMTLYISPKDVSWFSDAIFQEMMPIIRKFVLAELPERLLKSSSARRNQQLQQEHQQSQQRSKYHKTSDWHMAFDLVKSSPLRKCGLKDDQRWNKLVMVTYSLRVCVAPYDPFSKPVLTMSTFDIDTLQTLDLFVTRNAKK